MAPLGRTQAKMPPLRAFDLPDATTTEDETSKAVESEHSFVSSSSVDGDDEKGDQAADFEFSSQYSIDESVSESSSGESENEDATPSQRFLHHSNSSSLMSNTFAPPFYNRPPTPLPASPSLTSLLRPPFSTTTSRPTTPDSSENDTPNDTESAVTKSARIAATVPRASPKVPTYEYYGFVLYLMSSLAFGERSCLAFRDFC